MSLWIVIPAVYALALILGTLTAFWQEQKEEE
jgi:hypothetical protein